MQREEILWWVGGSVSTLVRDDGYSVVKEPFHAEIGAVIGHDFVHLVNVVVQHFPVVTVQRVVKEHAGQRGLIIKLTISNCMYGVWENENLM